MLTWVIVKTRIDSSLNLYKHCVACDDKNNCCPAGPTLRGSLPPLPCIRLALYTLFEVLKHLEKRCTATFCLQRWPAAVHTAPFCQHKCAPKAKQALFGVFWVFCCTQGSSCFYRHRPRSARINLVNYQF